MFMDGRPQFLPVIFVLAAAGLAAGCQPPRSSAEQEAIAWVERMGGKVKYDDAQPGSPVVEVALGGTSVAGAQLGRLATFTKLQTLSLFDTSVGDEGLERIAEFKTLKTLYLGRTRVTDAGLKRWAAGGNDRSDVGGVLALQTLGLSDTAVSDASLDVLATLPHLKSVNLRHTRVTAAGVARLKRSRQDLVVHL